MWAWPRDFHSVSWEYSIVLPGHGEMVQASGGLPIPMAPGERIIQPPGWIHTIASTGEADLVSCVIADNPDDECCYYPDSDKWAAGGTRQTGGKSPAGFVPGVAGTGCDRLVQGAIARSPLANTAPKE